MLLGWRCSQFLTKANVDDLFEESELPDLSQLPDSDGDDDDNDLDERSAEFQDDESDDEEEAPDLPGEYTKTELKNSATSRISSYRDRFSNFVTFERHPITDAEEGKAVSMENNVKFALNQGSTEENVPLEGEEKPEKRTPEQDEEVERSVPQAEQPQIGVPIPLEQHPIKNEPESIPEMEELGHEKCLRKKSSHLE
jgi:hypothetical protein